LAGGGVHDPRHHLQGGVLFHDRLGTRLPGLHQLSARAEPRVRLSCRCSTSQAACAQAGSVRRAHPVRETAWSRDTSDTYRGDARRTLTGPGCRKTVGAVGGVPAREDACCLWPARGGGGVVACERRRHGGKKAAARATPPAPGSGGARGDWAFCLRRWQPLPRRRRGREGSVLGVVWVGLHQQRAILRARPAGTRDKSW